MYMCYTKYNLFPVSMRKKIQDIVLGFGEPQIPFMGSLVKRPKIHSSTHNSEGLPASVIKAEIGYLVRLIT